MHHFLKALLVSSVLSVRAVFSASLPPSIDRRQTSDDGVFRWTDITPSPELQYTDCFNNWQCARLQVPMDWNSTTDTDTVAIAIVRIPAKVPVTDPRYGGPILINPGGPGGSGVQASWYMGAPAQLMFDAAYLNGSVEYLSNSPDAKYFDMIGFDPRGVNNTTPFINCTSSPSDEVTWALQGSGLILGAPEANFDYMWQRAAAIGTGCPYDPDISPTGSKIANFASTAMVVRDMAEIVERHGEWREKQTNDTATLQRLKWQKGEEPLQYWAISYGSVLGATAAAMQPHRIKRMLIDGIVEANEYYSGLPRQSIIDADKVMDRFFEYCALAGKNGCPFYAGDSANDTRDRLQDILDDVRTNGPIPVPGHDGVGPSVITLSDILAQMQTALYFPAVTFPAFAALMAGLSDRNGSVFASYKNNDIFAKGVEPPSTPINPLDPDSDTHKWATGEDFWSVPILCGDSSRSEINKTGFLEDWYLFTNQSHWTGDRWATILLPCANWNGRPPWVFADEHTIASNVTATPLLFASTVFDPVTPLLTAKQMQALFKGSGLMVVDGEGHSTLAAPSLCAAKAYRAYFQTGQLPEDGIVCNPNTRPFLGDKGPGIDPIPANATKLDTELAKAQQVMAAFG